MRKFASITLSIFVVGLLSTTVLAADTKVPDDVTGVKASAMDGAVKVTWKAGKDDVGVEGYQVHYGTESVKEDGKTYSKNEDVGDVTEYVIEDLKNGTKYYFAVVAYDKAGNESIGWSLPEASATPSKDAGSGDVDKDAPKVAKAESLNIEEVKVVFSEEIVLPKEDPQDAFAIEDDDEITDLPVKAAEMDKEDKTNKTVILTTADQKDKAKYKLTVALDIKDKAGNPIISGTSDTAIFDGSDKEKPAEDSEGPNVVKVESVDGTHVIVSFNETVVLGIDPSENFEITSEGEGDKGKKLEVLGVELGKNSAGVEDSAAIVTTSKQEKIKYVVKVVKLEDETGNVVNAKKNSAIFEGKVAEEKKEEKKEEEKKEEEKKPEADLIAPKDVANFLADKVLEAKKYVVKLTWKVPEENKKDTKEQLIYMSEDKGAKYDKKASVGPEVEKYDVADLKPGEYWFKITQKDAAGNESQGVVSKIILSETGPEMIGLLAFSLLMGRVVTRRKK